jgi:hypothetical protein
MARHQGNKGRNSADLRNCSLGNLATVAVELALLLRNKE